MKHGKNNFVEITKEVEINLNQSKNNFVGSLIIM